MLEPERATSLLRVGALAVSPNVRALLDRIAVGTAAPAWGDLLGDSPAACALREAIARAARAPFPVLIEGESGSGKELVARAIHRLGARRDRRFCALNCAALSDELIEAELFGHAARRVHRGRRRARRPVRGGRRRDAVPRRDRRALGSRPGQAAARASGRRGPPCRRERLAAGRRPDRGRDQSSSRAGSRRRPVPRRFAVPARRRPHRGAAAPRTSGDVPLLANHFWSDAAAARRFPRDARARGRSPRSRATTGPATCASCRT